MLIVGWSRNTGRTVFCTENPHLFFHLNLPKAENRHATSPLQSSSFWRFWWFLWIRKMEMDIYSSTFLPKNSGSSQKQAEPPNASSCRRPAQLRPCPHIHTLGKAQFFLSLATKQEKPTCSSLFLSDTYSKGQQHCWIIIKKGMLSLTEDGKPGGTFRTFFVWMSKRKKKRKQ